MPSYVPTVFVGMYAPCRSAGHRHAKERHICATRDFCERTRNNQEIVLRSP